ncbi:hypothetical protein R80B4_00160 [Fibrobacteres bacterium R8-0-B4]
MLKFLIEKEFKQIARNSFVPKIIIGMPLVMMLILPWAANQSIKNVNICVVDNDRSVFSERLINKIASSGYFKLSDAASSYNSAMKSIESGSADIVFEIENGFEEKLFRENAARVMISANAVSGIKGGLGSSYLASILTDYAAELREAYAKSAVIANTAIPTFGIAAQYKFNPRLDYKVFMVPALMVMLLTMIAGFLPALNIVGEKEAGTIEQMNVSPVKNHIFILSKLIPYWVIGFVVLSLCLVLAASVYRLYPSGSVLTIYLFAGIYILIVSGFGLVVSNYSNTMQQAMFVMFFFVMVFILMSGLFTPIASMPDWAQNITAFNPLKYLMQVMRMVYLKGSSFSEMIPQFLALGAFAVVLNGWAILCYKKSS